MKHILSLSLVVLLLVSLRSQEIGEFRPLEIHGLSPKWIHYSYDSTIVNHQITNPRANNIGFDGFGHVYTSLPTEHLIKDNYWYKISNTTYDVDISGGLIEKIDLNTGQRIWFDAFDLRTQSYRESVHSAEIIDEILWVYSLRITREDSPIAIPFISLGNAAGVLKIRGYNIHTGHIDFLYESEPLDSNSRQIISGFYKETLIRQIKTKEFEIIEYRNPINEKGPFIVRDTVNTKGVRINSADTLYSNFQGFNWINFYFQDWRKIYVDKKESLYWLDFYIPGPISTDPNQCILHIFERNGFHREIDLERYNRWRNTQGWSILDIKENMILIVANQFNGSNRFLVIDLISENILQEGEYQGIFNNTTLNKDGSVLVFIYRNEAQNDLSNFDFYALQKGSMNRISTFQVAHEGYFLIPSRVKQLDDGDFLISFLYTQQDRSSFKGRFMTDIRVSPEMINFVVSTSDPNNSKNSEIKIWPNPVVYQAHISIDSAPDRYKLFNIVGQCLADEAFNDIIDMEYLNSGLYYINLYKNDSFMGSTGLFIKM